MIHQTTVLTTTCPKCASPIAASPDPVAGTVTCSACGTRFDPRADATAYADHQQAGADAPSTDSQSPVAPGSAQQPDSNWQPAAGDEIGDYTLIDELGRGGMATVWRAKHHRLGRLVAVKILHAHLATDSDLRRRFAREAEALVLLEHPHVVPVIDRGEHRSRPYLVTQLVGTRTLRDLLRAKQVSPTALARIADHVLSALAHAHERGLIHRDVKPENIIISDDGRAFLGDFGIAQVGHGIDGQTLTHLTNTNVVLGTVAYMAPEQATANHSIDHRCDLYALGVVCYEALSGHLPQGRFEDPSHTSHSLPPAQRAAWDAFILPCLERDPAQRPADAEAARALLHAITSAATASPTTATARSGADREPSRQANAQAPQSAPAASSPPPPPPPPMPPPMPIATPGIASTTGPTAASDQTTTTNINPVHGRTLYRDPNNKWIGGVCGGLAAWTGIHSGWWRAAVVLLPATAPPAGFVLMAIAYAVACAVIPLCPVAYRPHALNSGLPKRPPGWLLGVCALAEQRTTLPAWLWRIASVFLAAIVWPVYLAAGIILPAAKPAYGVDLLGGGGSGGDGAKAQTTTTAQSPTTTPDTNTQHLPARPTMLRFWGAAAVVIACAALTAQSLGINPTGQVLGWLTVITVAAALLGGWRSDGRPASGTLGGAAIGLYVAGVALISSYASGAITTTITAGYAISVLLGLVLAQVCALLWQRHAATAQLLTASISLSALTGSYIAGIQYLDQSAHIVAIGIAVWVVCAALVPRLLRSLTGDQPNGRNLAGSIVAAGHLCALLIALVSAMGLADTALIPGQAMLAAYQPLAVVTLAVSALIVLTVGRSAGLRVMMVGVVVLLAGFSLATNHERLSNSTTNAAASSLADTFDQLAVRVTNADGRSWDLPLTIIVEQRSSAPRVTNEHYRIRAQTSYAGLGRIEVSGSLFLEHADARTGLIDLTVDRDGSPLAHAEALSIAVNEPSHSLTSTRANWSVALITASSTD